jgi:hypothetical protein
MLKFVPNALRLAVLGSAIACAPVSVAFAQDTDATEVEAEEQQQFVFSEDEDMFIVGTTIDLMFHEAGHMVIDLFDIPILGQEEDAADNFASLALLSIDEDYANAALLQGISGWYLLGANLDDATSQLFDEHDFSTQRASRKVCHLISSEPETYSGLAADLEINADMAAGCAQQFAKTLNNWVKVLEEKNAFGETENTISIAYYDAKPGWEEYRQVLKDNGVLEYVVDYLSTQLALPRDISVTAQHCDTPNAFYSSDQSRMTFCYEFANLLHAFWLNMQEEGEEAVEEVEPVENEERLAE